MRTAITVATGLMVLAGLGVCRAEGQDLRNPALPGAGVLASPGDDTTPARPAVKSPGAAARLSLAGTVVPFVVGLQLTKGEGASNRVGGVLVLGSVIVGPSLGYFYGGCNRRAITGIAIRGGLLAIMGIAATKAEFPSLLGSDDRQNAAAGIVELTFVGTGIAVLYDLLNVSDTVQRHNNERRLERPIVSPTVGTLHGSGAPALGIAVRF